MRAHDLRWGPLLLALLLTACSPAAPTEDTETAQPLQLDSLTVEIARSGQTTQQLTSAVRELPELLESYFADTAAVWVGRVTVTVGASAADTAQALADSTVDLAFLPAESFVEYGGAAAALLADAAPVYLRAAPTDYGSQLAVRGESNASPLTWEELRQASCGVTEETSACLDLWLSDQYEGSRLSDLPSVTVYADEDALLQAVKGGQVDVYLVRQETDGAVLAEPPSVYTLLAAAAAGREELTQASFVTALEKVLTRLDNEHPQLSDALGGDCLSPVDVDSLDATRRLLALYQSE